MFRPFLPCGIAYGFAYGFAYGIPCSFSGGRHPAGLFVLYHIGAVLVNRFRQNFGGICLFPAPGVPPCRGGLLRRCRRGGRWRRPAGGVLSLLPAYSAFSFCFFPYPPDPLPRRGRGRPRLFSCKGLRPLHPRGWMGHGTGFTCGKPILAASNGTLAPAGGGNPDCKKPLPLCICMAGAVSAACGSVQGCRGRSPRRNKL